MTSRSAEVPGSFACGGVLLAPAHNGDQQPENKGNDPSNDDGEEYFTGAIANDELFSRGAFLLRQSSHSALLGGSVTVAGLEPGAWDFGTGASLGLTHGTLIGPVGHLG